MILNKRFGNQRERLFLVLLVITFSLSGWVNIEPAVFDILVVFLIIISLFSSYISYNRATIVPLLFIWLFLITNLLSMFFMKDFPSSMGYFLITFYLCLLWLLITGLLNSFKERAGTVIMLGYILAGLSSAILGILAYAEIIPHSESYMYLGRVKGLFKDPNVFGPFLVPVAVFTFLFIEKSRGRIVKLLWVFMFITVTAAIVLSFSRAAWANYALTFSILSGMWIFFGGERKEIIKRTLYIGLIIFLIFAFLSLILKNTTISEMLEQRFKLQSYDEDRFTTQSNALQLIQNNPLGSGPGQSEGLLDYSTHSLYVRVLGENGFIGFIILVAFLFITWGRSLYLTIRNRHYLYILSTSCLMGLYLNSLVIDTLHWRHFWVLLAIPWANFNGFSVEKNKQEVPKL
ncbi:O-antigen ligase family protein [Bacillaceae bacterium W0354]